MLQRLNEDQIKAILTRALGKWRGDEEVIDSSMDKEAVKQLAVYSDGDGKNIKIFHFHMKKINAWI